VTDRSSLHGLFAGDKWNIATTENAVAGWGGYQKPKKSKQQIDLERRRELGMKLPSDVAELQAIAAKSRKKPKNSADPAPRRHHHQPRAVSHRAVSVTRREHAGAAHRVGRAGRRALRR
jgi:hypothetical protein